MKDSYDGLRTFVADCERLGELRIIENADWNLEIGTLTEVVSQFVDNPPALLFDRIKGYPAGYRVLSLCIGSTRRTALALRLPVESSKSEVVRLASAKISSAKPQPPRFVDDGPVMQNSMTGDAVDLWRFPCLLAHAGDGGRYIGTGDTMLNRDPSSGFMNMASYRMQVHERNLLGLWMSPGQQGRRICEQYWNKGQSCPVVATFGGDPLLFMAAYTKFPWGKSELECAGGMLGEPVDVIAGPITGLPFPAHAEIAIEGEIPPPSVESRDEGPFGEWTGYYAGGSLGTGEPQPVIHVNAIYHRNDPIIVNQTPQWPGAPQYGVKYEGGLLASQMEAAGVPGLVGAYIHHGFFTVVSIQQQYAGHARQAGMAVLSCAATARNGRFVVVVDEDIDPTNLQEVFWAISTRVDPASDMQIIDQCWASPLDPRMPPAQKLHGPHLSSRAIIYAVRPFSWRDQFPKSSRPSREEIAQIIEKYRTILPL